ncbi:MAG: hypothetical protein EBQ80_03380 [Proteobacteria bacterium]|nr:hypothetical protein [Pseudomonadota bacterium]
MTEPTKPPRPKLTSTPKMAEVAAERKATGEIPPAASPSTTNTKPPANLRGTELSFGHIVSISPEEPLDPTVPRPKQSRGPDTEQFVFLGPDPESPKNALLVRLSYYPNDELASLSLGAIEKGTRAEINTSDQIAVTHQAATVVLIDQLPPSPQLINYTANPEGDNAYNNDSNHYKNQKLQQTEQLKTLGLSPSGNAGAAVITHQIRSVPLEHLLGYQFNTAEQDQPPTYEQCVLSPEELKAVAASLLALQQQAHTQTISKADKSRSSSIQPRTPLIPRAAQNIKDHLVELKKQQLATLTALEAEIPKDPTKATPSPGQDPQKER